MPRSFDSIFYGAAGTSGEASDDEFNRVSFLSHFDGANNGVNNAFDDGSASNHTISAQGSATQGSFGPFARPDGEWGVLLGDDNRLTVPATTDFDFGTGDFTVEFFVFPTARTGTLEIFCSAGAIGAGTEVQINMGIYSGGHGVSFYRDTGYVIQTAQTTANLTVLNEWNHIVLSRASGTVSLYLNGTRLGTASNTANINFSGLSIGAYMHDGNYEANGTFSNFRFVKGSAVYDPTSTTLTVPTSKLTAITNTELLTCQSNRFVDNSSNGHTITPVGTSAVTAFGPILTSSVYSAGTNGASAFIAARADGINIADSSEFNMTGEFSVEFWVYLISNDAGGIDIMFRGYGNGQNTQIGYEPSNRHLYLYNDANPVTSSTDMHINSWNHVVCCRTSSTTSIFLNGVRVGTASYSTAVDWGGGTTQLMAYGDGVYSPAGYATDLRLLKGSSAYDATASTLTVPTAPLTAITNTKLLLNMADGQAIDSAAQNNLTLYGNANTSTDQAKFGDTSLHLDGSGDYINVLPSGRGNIYNYTVEQWLYPTRNYSGGGHFDRIWSSGTAINNSVMLHFDTTTAPKIVLRSNDSIIWTSSVSISLNAWTHVAVSCDANGTRLYIAGTERATSSTVVNLRNLAFNIGTSDKSQGFFQGYIDDFRISDFARYTGNFTAPAEPFADKGR